MKNQHRESFAPAYRGLRGECPILEGWRVPHQKRPPLSPRRPVHLVLRVRRDVWSLRSRPCYRALKAAFFAGCDRFGFRLIHFAVKGNHIHLIGEADDKRSLSRGMQGLAVRMAKALNRVMGRQGSVFAERYHSVVLRTVSAVRAVMNLILPSFGWDMAAVQIDAPVPLWSAYGPLVVPRSPLLRDHPG